MDEVFDIESMTETLLSTLHIKLVSFTLAKELAGKPLAGP